MNTSPSNRANAKSPALSPHPCSARSHSCRSLCMLVQTRSRNQHQPSTSESAPPAATPTFYRDVAPILQQHCEICHRAGGIAPMPLQTYSQAKTLRRRNRRLYKKQIDAAMVRRPRHRPFLQRSLAHSEQIATLSRMVRRRRSRRRLEKDAPPPIHWSECWTIAQPDQIFPMTRGVAIPKDGDVDYTYEIVPTHFTEDRWIQSVEVLPSLRGNVHHAVVYVRPPNAHWLEHAPVGVPFTADELTDPDDRRGAHWTDADVLLVYAPGSSPDEFPPTMAKFVPAGSDLVFQMHYTTNGHAGTDTTRVGMRFAKTPPPKRVLTLQLTNDHFVIPPGAPDYRVEARGTLPNDALLLSLFPHMHLRGKRFEYNIVHPIQRRIESQCRRFGNKSPSRKSRRDPPPRELSLPLADELQTRRTHAAEGRHRTPGHRVVRQFQKQSAQSRSRQRRPLGRSNLRRNDGRFFRRRRRRQHRQTEILRTQQQTIATIAATATNRK